MKHISTPLYLTILLIVAALLVGYSLGTPTRFPRAEGGPVSSSCPAGVTVSCSTSGAGGGSSNTGSDQCVMQGFCKVDGNCNESDGYRCNFDLSGGPLRESGTCTKGRCPILESSFNPNTDPINRLINPFDSSFDFLPPVFINQAQTPSYQPPQMYDTSPVYPYSSPIMPEALSTFSCDGIGEKYCNTYDWCRWDKNKKPGCQPKSSTPSAPICGPSQCSYGEKCWSVGDSTFGGAGSCGGPVSGIKDDGTCEFGYYMCA